MESSAQRRAAIRPDRNEVLEDHYGMASSHRLCIQPNDEYTGTDKELMDLELERINYHKGNQGKYLPRAVLGDHEPGTMDSVRAELHGRLSL